MRTILFTVFMIASCGGITAAPRELRVSPVAARQIIDASNLQRRSADQVEVNVARERHPYGGRGRSDLLIFHLDGRPIATMSGGQLLRLYLRAGSYRFGVIPSSNRGLYRMTEIKASISKEPHHLYRIYQSGGFTSSGGNAIFEIVPAELAANPQP